MKKHTKGKVQAEGQCLLLNSLGEGQGFKNMILFNYDTLMGQREIPEVEKEGNVKLFAEAFNVSNATGLSPLELKEENEKMRGVLKMMQDKRTHAGWDAECCALLADALLTESLTPSKGQN